VSVLARTATRREGAAVGADGLFDEHARRRAAERLAALLGETKPIFTPPWNRCTETTALCLVELGFRALARDAGAPRLNTDGLDELNVHVDWARPERRERVAGPAPNGTLVGVMLHHETMDATERHELAQLVSLLAEHENARCVALGATDP
jgi:hypothetical protein